MPEAVIVATARTPMGRYGGQLKDVRPDDLAAKPPLAVRLAKEAVLKAFDAPLSDGLAAERKSFYFLFATEDQKEGMHAFLEKRKGVFKGR